MKLKGNQGVSEEVVLLYLISYSNRVSEVLDLISRLGNEKNSKDVFSWGDPLTRGKGHMSLSMRLFKLRADKAESSVWAIRLR